MKPQNRPGLFCNITIVQAFEMRLLSNTSEILRKISYNFFWTTHLFNKESFFCKSNIWYNQHVCIRNGTFVRKVIMQKRFLLFSSIKYAQIDSSKFFLISFPGCLEAENRF